MKKKKNQNWEKVLVSINQQENLPTLNACNRFSIHKAAANWIKYKNDRTKMLECWKFKWFFLMCNFQWEYCCCMKRYVVCVMDTAMKTKLQHSCLESRQAWKKNNKMKCHLYEKKNELKIGDKYYIPSSMALYAMYQLGTVYRFANTENGTFFMVALHSFRWNIFFKKK